MIAIHIVVGFLTLLASIVLLVWNIIRLSQGWHKRPSFYRVMVSLLDLQALLGIITIVMHFKAGAFLLHPIAALVTVGFGHAFLKDTKPAKTQLIGYVGVLVLILLTIWLGKVA